MVENCECEGTLHFVGYASMGGSHSNYYECRKCGNVYEVWDYNRYPRVLITKKRIFKEPYTAQKFGVDQLLAKVDQNQIELWANSYLWSLGVDEIAGIYKIWFGKEIPLDYGYKPPKAQWVGAEEV